jgi:hypothetical protein
MKDNVGMRETDSAREENGRLFLSTTGLDLWWDVNIDCAGRLRSS